MTSTRKTALAAGLFYLLSFVSLPTLFLYNAVRGANYIVGSGPDTSVFVGGTLELIVALAGIGTAVALYPVVKRQNEGMALGFVGVRTVEAAMIFVGVFTLLSVVALRRAGSGTSALATSHALISMHDWTFVLGQSLFPPVIGFIGAPLLVASSVATLFGVNHYGSGISGVAGLPIAVWEFSLGVYLVVKGFRAEGLQKLGFEPVESVEPASATAPR